MEKVIEFTCIDTWKDQMQLKTGEERGNGKGNGKVMEWVMEGLWKSNRKVIEFTHVDTLKV